MSHLCQQSSSSISSVLQGQLQGPKMSQAVASYDQLAHQVAALRQENNHLRRELEDNCNHLSKLETETFSMKVHTTHTHKHTLGPVLTNDSDLGW